EEGVYTEEAGEYAGSYVRDANDEIVNNLRDRGLLLSEGTHKHRYGHCWRCDTPIIFVATDQWFVTVVPIKEKLKEELKKSEWYPEWARDSRFWDWVDNARDWCISRQRYWGTPMPVWECENEHRTVVGTLDELEEKTLDDTDVRSDNFDMHRPTVDSLKLECDECGQPAERVEDIFDVWLDSAVASLASLDYPQREDKFEEFWPADLIIEAHDQTRGWFWSQLAMCVAALDKAPYKEVAMYGHMLDENGEAMSKSRGNIVSPVEVVEEYGADPFRLYLLLGNPDGEDIRFSWDRVEEMYRRLNVFWNTFRFPLPYMDLDDFDPSETTVEDVELTEVDRWVLSRLQSVKSEVEEHMEELETHKAQETLLSFVTEDVSRFYVQVVRPRMWDEDDSEEKLAAYATLYRVLEESVTMLAPFAPFVSESMYQRLDGSATTVHELYWPEVNEGLLDKQLESDMEVLRQV
ncbi:MAG: class I tRNA ligase family protein, partial [Halobacteria archaeon]|nr:class I tRNA ligase family protein [Halobacteria archaeon]